MITQSLIANPSLWCSYYLTTAQKRELLSRTLLEFEKPIKMRLKPFQLVELVRHMIHN